MWFLDFTDTGEQPRDGDTCCYTCGTPLALDNRLTVYIEGGAFTTSICADDATCADHEDVQRCEPHLVTCDGWLDEPNEKLSISGTPCREEFYASEDKPVCPACGYTYEWTHADANAAK